ncbi:hypothetical protein [Herbaspirillum sp. YR522]|uniref:hypothetical protein n=1 Tax=Herbaspirillum sp. YR522 TaxID=1144342 RepID=UPI00026F6D72|nr:hypothetical protein [Herbaspirillum sp. YR522]EJN09984.1 hypothetical protein PMI40_00247 [Herbaspirillum sp. YR522]
MTLKNDRFTLHDTSGFPLVRFHNERASAGYALQWQHEMEALLAHGAPFVILTVAPHGEETQDDRKSRGIWLKHHRQALSQLCLGLASVEPDAVKLAALRQMAQGATRAFGVQQFVTATEAEAIEALSRVLRRHDEAAHD